MSSTVNVTALDKTCVDAGKINPNLEQSKTMRLGEMDPSRGIDNSNQKKAKKKAIENSSEKISDDLLIDWLSLHH